MPVIQGRNDEETVRFSCRVALRCRRKKTTDDVAKRHAPYRAALKNDKLRLVIDETHGHVKSYALQGGQYTADAKKLGAASVWFLDLGAPSNARLRSLKADT